MSKVVAIMSMSLDGHVADLNDGVTEVFDWYFTSGDVEFHTGGADPMTFKVSGPSDDPGAPPQNAAVLKELPFQNKEDFEEAQRGLIAPIDPPVIPGDSPLLPIWDPARS
jgi:hypothetical protein